MKNLLVTGGTGFIGGRLLQRAVNRADWKVNLLSSREILGHTCVLHRGYTFSIEDFYAQGIEHIDAVIHLGGFSPKERTEMRFRGKYINSIQNTSYLLDHLPNVPEQFIFCSSISVYQEDLNHVITEETNPNPPSLYGDYKIFCEKMISHWGEENGVKVQIARLGNIYGPGEGNYHYSIPLMIQQAVRGEGLSLFADPAMRRNYLYVDDACDMLLNALTLDESVGVINLVSGRNVTMEELVRTIAGTAVPEVPWSVREGYPLGGDILFSNEKAKKYLGKERFTLQAGIKKEFNYFLGLIE